LVLFNPVIDNGPGGYGFERIGDQYKDFSPLHNIEKGAPPTILFLGTEDSLIPVETVQYYKIVMEKVGSRCDIHLYEGQKHGFFNLRNIEFYNKTVFEADKFLTSLGYLSGEPTISIE
ncbi:MAG: alpha/beta hydrolase, partial [Cyclobacteriaceae bacterium]|nr:alpha/beta hydrolase [Cyclobacteriaceae bacterium]